MGNTLGRAEIVTYSEAVEYAIIPVSGLLVARVQGAVRGFDLLLGQTCFRLKSPIHARNVERAWNTLPVIPRLLKLRTQSFPIWCSFRTRAIIPGGKLVTSQKDEFRELVDGNPSTSVIALRAGKNGGDTSRRRGPAAEIAPQFDSGDFTRRQKKLLDKGSSAPLLPSSELTAVALQELNETCPNFLQKRYTLDGEWFSCRRRSRGTFI